MKDFIVNILGTDYQVKYVELKDENIDGDCDSTSKVIRVRTDNVTNIGNMDMLQKEVLRHELIHAFLHESGLGHSWYHPNEYGHDETTVDWFAKMSPRIFKLFQELDIL